MLFLQEVHFVLSSVANALRFYSSFRPSLPHFMLTYLCLTSCLCGNVCMSMERCCLCVWQCFFRNRGALCLGCFRLDSSSSGTQRSVHVEIACAMLYTCQQPLESRRMACCSFATTCFKMSKARCKENILHRQRVQTTVQFHYVHTRLI